MNTQNNGTKADREFDQFANCDQLEDMDIEIDKDEEQLLEPSMSNLIDQM